MDDLQIPQEVRGFLESMLAEANMDVDDATREEMIKELYARLDNYLVTVIVNNLPAEHLDDFVKLNEEKRPQEEINTFLEQKMPNAKEVFAKAFVDFRQFYLGGVATARNPEENKGE
jgi:hypothetical protein